MGDTHPRGSKVFAIVERSFLLVKVPSRDNELTLNEKTSEAGCHRIPKVFTVSSSMFKEAFGRRKSYLNQVPPLSKYSKLLSTNAFVDLPTHLKRFEICNLGQILHLISLLKKRQYE
ncbi:hypothetical protein CDAR_526141 [Caerostris darwini]|uniref:Uncharacterized protein n=1 Tax=Caerostris darwini TaxID=1538125 RepID=A0AAV4UHW1_9ARAC|nr:hypothetical protein CDAR_526141 [Caerostris darwini]